MAVEQLARAASVSSGGDGGVAPAFTFSLLVRGVCRCRVAALVEAHPFYRVEAVAVRDPSDSGLTPLSSDAALRDAAATLRASAMKLLRALREEAPPPGGAAGVVNTPGPLSGATGGAGLLSRRALGALESASPGALADGLAALVPDVRAPPRPPALSLAPARAPHTTLWPWRPFCST